MALNNPKKYYIQTDSNMEINLKSPYMKLSFKSKEKQVK